MRDAQEEIGDTLEDAMDSCELEAVRKQIREEFRYELARRDRQIEALREELKRRVDVYSMKHELGNGTYPNPFRNRAARRQNRGGMGQGVHYWEFCVLRGSMAWHPCLLTEQGCRPYWGGAIAQYDPFLWRMVDHPCRRGLPCLWQGAPLTLRRPSCFSYSPKEHIHHALHSHSPRSL